MRHWNSESRQSPSVRSIGLLKLGSAHDARCQLCDVDQRWIHWVRLEDKSFVKRLALLIAIMPLFAHLNPESPLHGFELLISTLDEDEWRGGLTLFAISSQRQLQQPLNGKGEPHVVVGCTDGTIRLFCPGVTTDAGVQVVGTHRGRVPVNCIEVSARTSDVLK